MQACPAARPRMLLAALLALGLSGCTLSLPTPWAEAPARPAPEAPVAPDTRPAAGACSETAQAQGLEVLSVRGSRDVTDAGGQVIGQDVTLQVRRAGQSYDVRCSYTVASGEARIMSL